MTETTTTHLIKPITAAQACELVDHLLALNPPATPVMQTRVPKVKKYRRDWPFEVVDISFSNWLKRYLSDYDVSAYRRAGNCHIFRSTKHDLITLIVEPDGKLGWTW
ncbi:hypothetical protein AWB71_05246 [Caballeronia peredens]|nr:hypothetical protein AWB71_05246 [Caballeronia peredens]